MSDCIFCKIANGEIPKEFIYKDDTVMVFPDIHPLKPIHLLIVTKKHIPETLAVEDHALFAHIFKVVQQLITKYKLENSGYRITINGGGAQVIDHLHIHLLGPMGKAATM